ncbi:hypothetical protein [Kutzneria kofuensis]
MRVGTVAIASLAAIASVSFAVPAAAATTAQIRVDQVGYATGRPRPPT